MYVDVIVRVVRALWLAIAIGIVAALLASAHEVAYFDEHESHLNHLKENHLPGPDKIGVYVGMASFVLLAIDSRPMTWRGHCLGVIRGVPLMLVVTDLAYRLGQYEWFESNLSFGGHLIWFGMPFYLATIPAMSWRALFGKLAGRSVSPLEVRPE